MFVSLYNCTVKNRHTHTHKLIRKLIVLYRFVQMPRNDLTLDQKLEILNKIKQQPPNTTVQVLSQVVGVSKTTIGKLLKNEAQLREQSAAGGTSRGQKRKRTGKDPDVEDALLEWFTIVTGCGVQVIGPMLHGKAEDLARKLGHEEFTATDGWLNRWKGRHTIKFQSLWRKGKCKYGSVKMWKLIRLPEIMKQFSPEDIYNADETGLYYRATPDG
uniref:Tigger transposable element-derived protein 4 n=1 Tax=Anoplophora glabripennis TaxID=217634 RepID=V5G286_ANOGL